MAWIKVIEEAEAQGELKNLYDELIRKRGKLSNIMKIHSLNPPTMKAHMDLYIPLMFGKSGLSRPEREMIGVVVSKTNSCDYCITHHAIALNFYWKDDDKIRRFIENFREVVTEPRQKAMLTYAEKLTRTPEKMNESDVEALREVGFSDEEILTINLIASYFNFVNRVVLGLGVEFTPEEAAGYKY